jgi:two-component system sensor histidine kinase/response regulator
MPGKASPSEVIGRVDHDLAWSTQAEAYRADDRAVMESGTPRLFYEEPQTSADGRVIWLQTSKVPLRDAAGKVIGVLGMYEDISDAARNARCPASSARATSAPCSTTFPFIVWLKDEQSRFLAVNQGFADGPSAQRPRRTP